MGCATSLVKFILFFFNFLFVAGGIALIAFGVLSYNGYKTYEILNDYVELGVYQFPPILMMAGGGIVFLIAFMGCCGTLRESKCMMFTYATLLLILLIAEIGVTVALLTNRDELKDLLKQGMEKSLQDYSKRPEAKEVWDTMQHNLKCCGVDGLADWGTRVPESCCVEPGENCNNLISQGFSLFSGTLNVQGTIYKDGCLEKVIADLKTDYGIYGAAVLAGIELLGVIFGCCLGARFGRKLYHT